MNQLAVWLGVFIVMAPMQPRTVVDVMRQEHNVTQGFVCFSEADVRCIDDICGDEDSYWWITVNGNSDVNALTPVKPSDKVEWFYVNP